MKETQLHQYIKLAKEADLDGDYKSADKIDDFIKEAQNPLQTGWRNLVNKLRGVGDESARARRQIRDLRKGPNTVDRMRSQPSYDEALELLEDGKNISGHNPMVLRSNATLTDRIINALQPTYRQVQTKQKEFPELYEKWKAIYDAKIAELKKNGLSDDQIDDWLDNNPRERENLVSPLESQLVRMRDAHAALIENAIDQVCSAYQIPRNMENLNQIKARIASDRQLRGMLYDNSFTTDSMIEQVLQNSTIPMRSYLNNMGPWKRSMSPAVTGLLFLGAGAVGGAALKGQSQPQAPKGLAASPFVGVLTNELLADRKKAKLFDTPIETMEKYIKRKKDNGSIKPGITKKELYNMALIDLGEHVANNLIQYVMDKYGFTIPKNSTEKDFVVNLPK
jgi:hypothetical protein